MKTAKSCAPSLTKARKKYLENRTDILKKTILRAIRSEYQVYFKLFLQKRGLDNEDSDAQFMQYLGDFAEYLRYFADPSFCSEKYGNLADLPFTLGLLINYCKVKKVNKTPRQQKIMGLFHDILYKFTQSKFSELLGYPEMNFLFRQILTSEFVPVFINKHPTMQKEKDRYIKCIKSIMNEQ